MTSTMRHRHKTADEQDAKPEVFGPSEAETRQFGGGAVQAAQAAQFRQMMKAKVDAVSETVQRATSLFQNAIINEMLATKEGKGADKLIDTMVGIVISQLSGGFAKFLANGVKFLEQILKEALKQSGKGALGGKAKPANERELINEIVSVANHAADAFVSHAKALIDSMPDDQAVADMRTLSALRSSPAVREESFADSAQDGQVERGAENLFLEAAGAPITGPAEAEAMATAMLQSYKAERINVFDTIGERNDAVQDALSGSSAKQIKQAEKNTGLDESVETDKSERKRATDLTNPIVPPSGSSQEEPVS